MALTRQRIQTDALPARGAIRVLTPARIGLMKTGTDGVRWRPVYRGDALWPAAIARAIYSALP